MRRLIVATVVVSVGVVGAHVTPATAAFPGEDGLIAFQRTLKNDKGGFADRIVTVRENGRKLKAITPRCCRRARRALWRVF